MRRAVPRTTALVGAGLAVALAGCLYAAAGAASSGGEDGGGGGDGGEPPGPGSATVRTMSAAAVVDSAVRPQAPALEGADLDGKPVGLAEFRGQVVVLNVWGSWCGPCRAEADDLERLSGQTRAQGVRFLGINTRDRDRATARSFVRAHGLGFPSLHDPTGELLLRFPPALLNPQTIPSTLVIDRRGRIAVSIGGAVTEEELSPLLTRVAQETS
ncbi:TlpA disulfide reductase family protein [Streptomyces sp. AP-93]|uniref:TlpA family protein disulfide reductase n=1 Tax=Streptomyces sp. AP-93 TaxID=2929048 RepID=UPI001FAFF9E6|nr:TlpA disulfide reductase family protein [Streptomyces sp. AP-93]MCJ0869575.1 TlpA family protein disulfide reductase [Streptomyces sp. AP-93]